MPSLKLARRWPEASLSGGAVVGPVSAPKDKKFAHPKVAVKVSSTSSGPQQMEMMRQWTACIAKTHLTEGWQTEETGELLAAANNVCLCVCVCVCACVCV
jgi:hypothetical protein